MEDFPGNSIRSRLSKEEPPTVKKVEKAIVGEVVRRRKPLGSRLHDTFFGGDARSVAGYVLMDVLVPAVKDVVVDMVSTAVERMIFGEGRGSSRRPGYRPGGHQGHVSYNRYATSSSSPITREDPREMSRRARSQHDFDEIILATRAEAQEVINRMFDLVSKYEMVTVADLYELVGITPQFTDHKYGWTDIRGTQIVKIGGSGYLLDLPRPEVIKS